MKRMENGEQSTAKQYAANCKTGNKLSEHVQD